MALWSWLAVEEVSVVVVVPAAALSEAAWSSRAAWVAEASVLVLFAVPVELAALWSVLLVVAAA